MPQIVLRKARSLLSLHRRNFPDRPPWLRIAPPIRGQPGTSSMFEPLLHLPLIAHLSQPIALPRRQSQICLHADKMHKYRQPHCHAKVHAQARTHLLRLSGPKVRVYDDEIVDRSVGAAALGVEFLHWVAGAVDEGDLVTRHGGVVGAEHGDNERGDDHDQTERDDGAEGEHCSQHPSAMLVDLEALDVVVCEADAGTCNDHEQADSRLSFDCPTEGSSADHEGTGVANEDEEDDNVAVDAVEDEQFVADDRHKLPDHEEASWKDGTEVDGDADPIDTGSVPVPLAR